MNVLERLPADLAEHVAQFVHRNVAAEEMRRAETVWQQVTLCTRGIPVFRTLNVAGTWHLKCDETVVALRMDEDCRCVRAMLLSCHPSCHMCRDTPRGTLLSRRHKHFPRIEPCRSGKGRWRVFFWSTHRALGVHLSIVHWDAQNWVAIH